MSMSTNILKELKTIFSTVTNIVLYIIQNNLQKENALQIKKNVRGIYKSYNSYIILKTKNIKKYLLYTLYI